MLKAQKILRQMYRQLTIVLIASLVWLVTLPTNSVQADGYYSEKNHHAAISKPYYVAKDRQVVVKEVPAQPYYSTKKRSKKKVIIQTPETVNGKTMIPQDLKTGTRQKDL